MEKSASILQRSDRMTSEASYNRDRKLWDALIISISIISTSTGIIISIISILQRSERMTSEALYNRDGKQMGSIDY